MLKKIGIIVIGTFILSACSKNNENDQRLASCKSNIVIDQLLSDNKSFDTKLFSESISAISFESIDDGSILCSAKINLNSLLDKHNKIVLPIKYKVKINDNKISYVDDKDSITKQKLLNWAKQTNDQVVDYRVLDHGVLFVKQDNNVSQSLNYSSDQISNNLLNNDNIKIEQEFNLNQGKVFLIGSYTGGTIDNNTKNHYLLSISANNQIKITQPFAYSGKITQNGDSLFIRVYDPEQVYLDESSQPLIEYTKGEFVGLDRLTPQYNDLTAKYIIEVATRDGCYDSKYQVFDLSNACDQALKYCRLFKKLQNPKHDNYYQILEQTCQ